MTILTDKSSVNFQEFTAQAIADMKAEKSLIGKEDVDEIVSGRRSGKRNDLS